MIHKVTKSTMIKEPYQLISLFDFRMITAIEQ